MQIDGAPPADTGAARVISDDDHPTTHTVATNQNVVDKINQCDIPMEPCRSAQAPQPSQAGLQSAEYRKREVMGRSEGQEWATNQTRAQALSTIDDATDHENIIACLTETKASHSIPRSYRHAITTDPDRWLVPMRAEMETLKAKHTWDLVQPPPGVNIMDSMWVYDIKWDGEGNRIKDKARVVGKGYTQQLGMRRGQG